MKSALLPHALAPGATIGICSPAGPVQPDKLKAAAKAIIERGYQVVLSPSVFERNAYLAGSDDIRLSSLYDMFERPDVEAVFASRGGYGVSRILARVQCERIASARKPFVGFSDITAFQWFLFWQTGLISFSGPLGVEWAGGVSEETLAATLRLLSGNAQGNLLAGLPKNDLRILRGGRCDGILWPGNLTLIASLLGTPFLPDLSGAILILEEVGEARYRLDRLLFHLRNAGIFSRINGLVIGDMTHGAPVEEDVPAVEQLVCEATAGYDFPIVCGIPYGHGSQRATLPVGAQVRLDSESGELNLLTPVVSEKA
jgi:muramoyltetrapeptide carboxypeptidase